MGRPKKGEPGYEEANRRWRKTMEERFGGPEGLHKKMQAMGAVGGRASSTGGFAANPALAVVAGARGGRYSRRGRKFLGEKDGILFWQVKETGKIESISEEEYRKECKRSTHKDWRNGKMWWQREENGGDN